MLVWQVDFFVTGNPNRRRPLTQHDLAAKIGIMPNTLTRSISNKSVRLPWNIEVPIKTLLPNAKSLLRERLYRLALKHPDFSDEELKREIERLYGAKLSRRSIAQYRKELGLAGRGKRKARQTSTAV
ncbi:MAG: hypothetical protein HY747_02340 [Elusimicrobia bacterium]|nr:hypothetical protein [Elusimicrobiota bacterium]